MEYSKYHYLNTLEDGMAGSQPLIALRTIDNYNFNDNINVLQQHFKIIPKIVYMIGYTNSNICNSNNVYFFDGETPLNKILEQQTLELPEIINIFLTENIINFLIFSSSILQQSKYIIVKVMDNCIRELLNELGFIQFYRENDSFYFVNINRTNMIYNSLN